MDDPYISITKKDYTNKGCKPIIKNFVPQEFKDPITESFKSYLTVEDKSENEIEAVDKFTENYLPKKEYIRKKYFDSKPILDKEVIINDQIDDKRTVYDIDYCDKELYKKYLLAEAKKKEFRLPNDWFVPLTIQKISYRDPLLFYSGAYDKKEVHPPEHSLGADKEAEVRKLQKIKTGGTEYQEKIGKTGEVIMNEKLVHKPNQMSQFHTDGNMLFCKTGNF